VIPQRHLSAIAEALEDWFTQQGKNYPWRHTTDPYAILVSEVMLQQTQITTVLERGFYTRWMQRFPDISTLATATEDEILHAWQGLGYYRRARNLQKLAQAVVEKHKGVLPTSHGELLALPGIGPYTAGAIASFAYDQPQPIVDGNVARVLSRLGNSRVPIDSSTGQTQLWQTAKSLVEKSQSPRKLNSALMELGQTQCRTGQPACLLCPVQSFCEAKHPSELPLKQKRIEITSITEHVGFDLNAQGILLVQETGPRRTGMWRLPELTAEHTTTALLHRMKYGITRYNVDLQVHPLPSQWTSAATPYQRVPPDQLKQFAIPAPYLRAIRAVLAK
jgi:A/G-specific adenine glycosylase